MAKVGFVGLGVMGSRMVERLLSKGHTVTGYNRTRAKAQWLIDKGMKWAFFNDAATTEIYTISNTLSRFLFCPQTCLPV